MFHWIGVLLISYPHIHEICMWGSVDYKLDNVDEKKIFQPITDISAKKRWKGWNAPELINFMKDKTEVCVGYVFFDHPVRQITYFNLS
jgi:hypothetical protein